MTKDIRESRTNINIHSFEMKMAFGEDVVGDQVNSRQFLQKGHDIDKVLDTCVRKDGSRYYKIRWKDSWEREDCLVTCERMIQEFWNEVKNIGSVRQMNGCFSRYGESEKRKNSPSPPASSGRRKGKPKKLANLLSSKDENETSSHMENGFAKFNNCFNGHYDSEDEKLSVEIPNLGSERTAVEEYPVMIIQEHNDNPINEETEPPAALQAEGLQANSPTQPSDSANMDACASDETHRKRRCYSDEVLRISNIKSIIHNTHTEQHRDEMECKKNMSENNYPISSSVSPIYLNKKHILPSLVSSQNGFSIMKPISGYPVSEGMSIIYEARPPRCKVRCIQADPTVGSKHEKITSPNCMNSEKLSPEDKLETSKLLLKVTSPGVVPSYASHTYMPPHQYPVYQSTPVITKLKLRTKEVTKSKIIDGEHRPQCLECFQTFKKRAALERHMMIHRGIKPFQCHFCNQRFRQKHHLQGHIMLHTGERPHSCTLCNKRFRMRHHLLEHERISHKVFR